MEQEKQIAVEQARNEEIRRQQHILEEQAAKIQLANTELQERNIQLDNANYQLSEQAAKIQLTNTELQERNIQLDNANYQLSEQAAKIQLTNTELQERNIELDNAYLQLSEQAAKIQLKNTELHETNIELNDANLKLEEAGKFKMKILGIASHDLKNPIAGINLSAEVLMRYEKLSPQSTKMMKNIMNSSKRMLDIVVNLMDVSARELGEIKLTHSSFDIVSLVEDISKEYLMRATEKKQMLEFESDGACTVLADEQCMRQIFDNLISNAIKYSPQEKRINISVMPSAKKVKVAIADQGLGLSTEDKALMFRDFQKLSSKPTGGESSTGLGLSVVKHLVELHGGKVWAESEGKGMGSTFFVELPL
ncbi:MAG: HAMP domain-containing histidine kinase [Ignavibacteriae bacterium]|nr:HAMP domain-containing histidine kinase [Ignavibacteriota bacterium]